MIINEVNGVVFLTFDIFKTDPIVCVHSTRQGGVSEGFYASMNLGFSRGDDSIKVHKNYELFSEAIGVPLKDLVLSSQWHHNNILDVKEEHKGMGIFKERSYHDVDGLSTDIKGLPLVTFYADCVPIYFYDPVQSKVAMTHAGWRGTSTAIVKDLINRWVGQGSNVKDIKAAIGPAVCKTCYEVTKEVIDAMPYDFAKDYYDYYPYKDRYHIDLKGINRQIIMSCGVEHIEVTDYCTKCSSDLFFSHRRQGNDRGTQIGVMMLGGEDE